MDPRSHLLIGDWQPVLLPPILYLNTAVAAAEQPDHGMGAANIFRELDVMEEWLGLGRPALRRTLPWVGATLALGAAVSCGAGVGVEATDGAGLCLRSLVDPGQLLLLRDHRPACRPSDARYAALIFCLSALGRFKRVEYRQIAVDSTAWYWHTMSLAWLLLLAVLAMGQ